jgi:ABC-type Fe3+ transport system substrate-binding protein
MDDTYLKELQSRGVGTKVERKRDFGTYVLTNGVSVLKNAPHPNATKVFMHWFLGKEGQDAWAQLASVDSNSRRTDIAEYHKEALPDYKNIDKYNVLQGTASGDAVLKQTLEITGSKR